VTDDTFAQAIGRFGYQRWVLTPEARLPRRRLHRRLHALNIPSYASPRRQDSTYEYCPCYGVMADPPAAIPNRLQAYEPVVAYGHGGGPHVLQDS
jgi:hypothetical protein